MSKADTHIREEPRGGAALTILDADAVSKEKAPAVSMTRTEAHKASSGCAPVVLPLEASAVREAGHTKHRNEHVHAAGSEPNLDNRKLSGPAHDMPADSSMLEGAGRALPEPAEAKHQQGEQGASSAQHRSSAGLAKQPQISQKQVGLAGSRRFTPAQQAVAAALMVVLKCVMKGGREAAFAAKVTLVSNNPATQSLLFSLPEAEPLPTTKQLQQKASAELLQDLAKLAKQCEAASCQPLEVFSRSVQCITHQAGTSNVTFETRLNDRRKWRHKKPTTIDLPHSWNQGTVRALHQLGVQQSVAQLIDTYVAILVLRPSNDHDHETSVVSDSHLNHMLPGTIDAFAETGDENVLHAKVLMRLVPSFTAALQAYQIRAAQCGQSFEHVVLLEAAVQGWSLDGDAGKVLRAIIAAEPPVTSARASVLHDARQSRPDAAAKEAPSGEAWGTLALEAPETAWLMESAFMVATTVESHTYAALRSVCPGLPDFASRGDKYDDVSELLHAAKVVKQQIQVLKHSASVHKSPLPLYIKELLAVHEIDIYSRAVQGFFAAVTRSAESIKVNVAMAKRIHISMHIQAIMQRCGPEECVTYYLTLLNKLMSICTESGPSSPSEKAIRQALPGVLECLFRLHEWPYGLSLDLKWAIQAVDIITRVRKQQARDAFHLGIAREEHIRNLLSVPGLREREAKLLKKAFADFSSAIMGFIDSDAGCPAAHIPDERSSINLSGEASGPHSGEASKADRRKAKKSRQRAARAEAEGKGSKESGAADSMDNAIQQEGTAEAKAPIAAQPISHHASKVPESFLAHGTPARSSEVTAGNGNSSLSPQPSLQLPIFLHHEQLGPDLPMQSVPAAQAAAAAAQEEEPWQQVKQSRHKPISHQAVSEASVTKAPKQDRGLPDEDLPALSHSHPWEVQAAAQHAAQSPLNSGKAFAPLHAQPVQTPTEQLRSASGVTTPQQASPQKTPHPKQPSQSHNVPCETQHKLSQATASGYCATSFKASSASQEMPHPESPPGSRSNAQAASADSSEDVDQDQEDLCIVCWEELREVVFYRCMHMCTCQGCARDIMAAGGLFPMCRASIKSTITARF